LPLGLSDRNNLKPQKQKYTHGYATFRSGRFRLSCFGLGRFGHTMKSCRNRTCSAFNANIVKSTRSFIFKNYKHDPRSNS